jgi:hypothetical protein
MRTVVQLAWGGAGKAGLTEAAGGACIAPRDGTQCPRWLPADTAQSGHHVWWPMN